MKNLIKQNLFAFSISIPVLTLLAARTESLFEIRSILILIYIQAMIFLIFFAATTLRKVLSANHVHFAIGLLLIIWAGLVPGESDFSDFYIFPLSLAIGHLIVSQNKKRTAANIGFHE